MKKKVPAWNWRNERLETHMRIADYTALPSRSTREMWAILDQSSPVSLWHRWFNNGHPPISKRDREVGRPSSGKHWSWWQSKIFRLSRDVRCRKAFPLNDLRFLRLQTKRVLKEVGSSPSSGNESTISSLQLILKNVREVRLCSFHCMGCSKSFLQPLNRSSFKLEGSSLSEIDPMSQSQISKLWRRGNAVSKCWVLGSDATRCWQA